MRSYDKTFYQILKEGPIRYHSITRSSLTTWFGHLQISKMNYMSIIWVIGRKIMTPRFSMDGNMLTYQRKLCLYNVFPHWLRYCSSIDRKLAGLGPWVLNKILTSQYSELFGNKILQWFMASQEIQSKTFFTVPRNVWLHDYTLTLAWISQTMKTESCH